MLISKRRLQAGVVLFLAILAAFLVRPARTWIDRTVFSSVVNGQLSANEMEFHTKTSVVELRGVRWTQMANGRKYGLEAERAWLAVDPVQLVDRQFHVEKIDVEGADLFVENFNPQSISSPGTWQQQLAMKVVQLDWEDVQEHFSSLLAADGIHNTWAGRIQQWVVQSELIVGELSQLEGGEELTDNPLRVEDQLKERIRSVEGLREEQAKLAGQFDTLQRLLDAECNRLKDSFDKELATLNDSATGPVESRDSGTIAVEISVELAECSWTLFSILAEVSDVIARDLELSNIRPSYDRDVTLEGTTTENPQLGQLQASGLFRCGDSLSPYAMRRDIASNGDWEFVYELPEAQVAVRVSDLGGDASAIELVAVRKIGLASSPSDRGVDMSCFSEVVSTSAHECIAKLVLKSDLSGIDGQLKVPLPNSDEMSLAWSTLRKNAEELVGPAETVLDIDIKGSWKQPNIALAGNTTPDWLVKSIQNELDFERRQSSTSVEAQAKVKFEQQISRLQSLVIDASKQGRQIVDSHQAALVAASEELQASLDELNGTSFARRPGAATTR